jgi:hypothetical protein
VATICDIGDAYTIALSGGGRRSPRLNPFTSHVLPLAVIGLGCSAHTILPPSLRGTKLETQPFVLHRA